MVLLRELAVRNRALTLGGLEAGSEKLGERCGEPTSSLSAEARSFTPVNKKKARHAMSHSHKRANTSTPYPKDMGFCVCARTVHVCTVLECTGTRARWRLAQGGRVGRAGESSFSCPPARPCKSW